MKSNACIKSHYDVLGLTPDASEKQIIRAYKNLALMYHPDRAAHNGLTDSAAGALFREINTAHEILIDPRERLKYHVTVLKLAPPINQTVTSPLFDPILDRQLKEAISSGNLTAVTELVDAGAFIHRYILMCAIESGHLDVVQYILQQKPNIHNENDHYFSRPISHVVIGTGNVALLKYLEDYESLNIFEPYLTYNTNDKIKQSLIPAAINSGSVDMVRYLLEEKGLISAFRHSVKNDEYCYEALKSAVRNSNLQKQISVQDRLNMVNLLLEDYHIDLTADNWQRLMSKDAPFASPEMRAFLQPYFTERCEAGKSASLI